MPRSAILTGRLQQRDRARLRGRLDSRRVPPALADARAELASWLDAHPTSSELAALEALDLTTYLRDTAHIDVLPEQRLRKLAIALECELSWRDEQPRAWLALDRIYAAALDLGERDASIHASRALSARRHAEALHRADDGHDAWIASPVRRRMMKTAYGAARVAVDLAPQDPDVLRTMAELVYEDPEGDLVDALGWYERALEAAPSDAWARLFRAHCLHDLERWREAADAYGMADPNQFTGPIAWRYEHLLEQRAHCWLRAGDHERAVAELSALLDRWDSSEDLAGRAWGWHLAEAARGPLRDALFDRTLRLFQREQAAFDAGRRDDAGFGLRLSMLDDEAMT